MCHKTVTILLRVRVRGHFVMFISKHHESHYVGVLDSPPQRGRELFSFGNDFTGLRDIPTGFVRGSATGKVKSVLPGTMVDV